MTNKPEQIDWHARAASLALRTRAFIDGKYVEARSGETFDCVNPANGKVLAAVASCGAVDVEAAVASARRTFESGVWSGMPPAERKRVLRRFAELLREHGEELALTETLDMGKPIADSLSVDIPGAARCIEWFGEAIDKVYDEVAPTGRDTLALVTREPVGVVGAIVPWNFPLLMASWKLGPALATGNSVVLKPSEKSPLTALRAAELAVEAGLPPGVFNVVPGFGHTAGEALALHMDVDCVAFTGSTRIGRRMLEYSGQSNMKRVWLECGGKSPNIVFADAADLERAASAAAWGIFFNQGEMCSAASRLVAHADVKDELVERIVAIGRTLAPGDPLDPATRRRRAGRRGPARNGYALHRGGPFRGREGRARRPARARAVRRVLRGTDGVRRRRHDHADRAGRDLRAGAVGADVSRRGRGGAYRQQRHVRARLGGLDP